MILVAILSDMYILDEFTNISAYWTLGLGAKLENNILYTSKRQTLSQTTLTRP